MPRVRACIQRRGFLPEFRTSSRLKAREGETSRLSARALCGWSRARSHRGDALGACDGDTLGATEGASLGAFRQRLSWTSHVELERRGRRVARQRFQHPNRARLSVDREGESLSLHERASSSPGHRSRGAPRRSTACQRRTRPGRAPPPPPAAARCTCSPSCTAAARTRPPCPCRWRDSRRISAGPLQCKQRSVVCALRLGCVGCVFPADVKVADGRSSPTAAIRAK